MPLCPTLLNLFLPSGVAYCHLGETMLMGVEMGLVVPGL
jgi:hypothetical protein